MQATDHGSPESFEICVSQRLVKFEYPWRQSGSGSQATLFLGGTVIAVPPQGLGLMVSRERDLHPNRLS